MYCTSLHWITRCRMAGRLYVEIVVRNVEIKRLEKEADQFPEQSYENPARYDRWRSELGTAINAVRLSQNRIDELNKGAEPVSVRQQRTAQEMGFPEDFVLDDEFYGDDDDY